MGAGPACVRAAFVRRIGYARRVHRLLPLVSGGSIRRAASSIAVVLAIGWCADALAAAAGASRQAACASQPDPAAAVESAFRDALLAYRPPAGATGGAARKDELLFAAREAKEWLAPHGDLLRLHVRWALERLPRERLPDMSQWEKVPARFLDEKDRAELEAQMPLRDFALVMFRDPTRAIYEIRSLSAAEPAARDRLVRETTLEAIAPARLVWANDDVDRPRLALVKRREVFEVDFARDAAGLAYLPQRIVWAQRPRPAPPSATPASDPGEAALAALRDAVESYDVEGAKDGPTQFTVAANASFIDQGSKLLAGKAEALRARARCKLLGRPRRDLPETKAWRVVLHGDPPNTAAPRTLVTLPLLKWEPDRFFASIRETARASVEGRTLAWRSALDTFAPPTVVRANDDLDDPILAVIDRDEVFKVTFHYDPSLPGYAPTDIAWLRRADPAR
jgi:hypothetical protein